MVDAPNDIDPQALNSIKRVHPSPAALDYLVDLSRRHFGWFTKHLPRTFEYPWLLTSIGDVESRKILDIGAGVSPLPVALSKAGAYVVTVDSSRQIRSRLAKANTWNEWGFLDYSLISPRIRSLNVDICDCRFSADEFDVAYSISVIEHVPADVRRRCFALLGRWVRAGGKLILTLDLVPGTEQLWNRNLGVEVEDVSVHGTLSEIILELADAGFELEYRGFVRDLPDTVVDVTLLKLAKARNADPDRI